MSELREITPSRAASRIFAQLPDTSSSAPPMALMSVSALSNRSVISASSP